MCSNCFTIVYLMFTLFGLIFLTHSNSLRKLDKDELIEIENKCNRKPSPPVGNRVIGGVSAPQGKFPFAIFLLDSENEICGASLISWRHAVTARHCLQGPWTSGLFIGGICRKKGPDPCKKGPYLKELKIDGVVWTNEPGREGDHAIIQLKKAVPKRLRKLVDIVCLPRADEPVPDTLEILGWGKTEAAKRSPNLRYAEVTTIIVPTSYPQCKNGRLICGTSPFSRVGLGGGDSGGGAVYYSEEIKRYIMYGISVAVGVTSEYGDVSLFVNVRELLDFYCTNLGLCME